MARGSGLILLVEDNPDDEALTIHALKSLDPAREIAVARDGREALDYLLGGDSTAGARPQPAVVLLDLKLPFINGLEVLQRLRSEKRTRHLPVVILTSSREQQDLLESYARGANSYVRKPVNFDEFMEAAGQLGSYWLGLNELPAT